MTEADDNDLPFLQRRQVLSQMGGTRIFACSDPWHDSNYAYWDGRELHHVEIERYTRSKYDVTSALLIAASRSDHMLDCCQHLAIEDGYYLAPAIRALLCGERVETKAFLAAAINDHARPSIQNGLLAEDPGLVGCITTLMERIQEGDIDVYFYNHHFSHCANAFISSRFRDALCISLDGGGTHLLGKQPVEVHGSVYSFRDSGPLDDNPIELISDWSPGWVWTQACKLLGLGPHDAGTAMAMAAYGRRDAGIRRLVASDSIWSIHPSEPPCQDSIRSRHAVCAEIGERLRGDEERFSFALELQIETERRVERVLKGHVATTSAENLCLSGGSFLNCVIAGKIRTWLPEVLNVHIPPVPYDAGISAGMVQAHRWHLGERHGTAACKPIAQFASTTTYSSVDVIGACRTLMRQDPVKKDLDQIADALMNGKIIALFQVGSETGRRALGNRSIICDPRLEANRLRINQIIKHRQWFRPFAPMITIEAVRDWFDVDENFSSPYMSFAVPFRNARQTLVPAVTHADGTARVQTVHRELTPTTHRLLGAWERRSGIPILLNTSFNDREPIVETPTEALATFRSANLDGLYFADHQLYVDRDGLTVRGAP